MNQDRRNQIVEILKKQYTLTNAEIIERFGISIETVRRDLAYLEQKGLLERVYGGAVRKEVVNQESGYTKRENENSDEKQYIATETEKLINQGDTVFFDLGTTPLAIARNIESGKKITAFTNALRTAVVLSEKGFDVFLPGGQLRHGELAVSGSLAENNMANFNIDKAIIGIGGITEKGITDFIADEASIRKQIIKNARTVIAVADYTKFGVRAMCNVCKIDEINVLVTDDKAPVNMLKKFKKKGVKVIVAGKKC